MEVFRFSVCDGPDIEFEGELLASTSPDVKLDRAWTELYLYKTAQGKVVLISKKIRRSPEGEEEAPRIYAMVAKGWNQLKSMLNNAPSRSAFRWSWLMRALIEKAITKDKEAAILLEAERI
jgi:hypothetical protein